MKWMVCPVAASVAASLVLFGPGPEMRDRRALAALVEKGASPLEARCALLRGDASKDALCAAFAKALAGLGRRRCPGSPDETLPAAREAGL